MRLPLTFLLRETYLRLSLPTDIGPVTLTADPVVFQRELRELYVQVGHPPSILFFLFRDRAQGLAKMVPSSLPALPLLAPFPSSLNKYIAEPWCILGAILINA